MDHVIIKLPKGKSALLGKLVSDDLISRQTIAVRDTVSLGMEGEGTIILIEGTDEALKKASEMVGEEGSLLPQKEKEEVYKRIKEDEDNVAEGLGLMFG